MNKNSAYVIPLVLILSACASDEVIVDTKGVNEQRYQQDLAECEVYSQQVNTGKTIAKRGTRGAVIGAIVGDGSSTAKGAGVGAVAGSARDSREAENKKLRLFKTVFKGVVTKYSDNVRPGAFRSDYGMFKASYPIENDRNVIRCPLRLDRIFAVSRRT